MTDWTIKKDEERKRDAVYDPRQRWIHLQQTIAWAEANLPPGERRNRPRQHPANTASQVGPATDRSRAAESSG
jgi:hypothetical protein